MLRTTACLITAILLSISAALAQTTPAQAAHIYTAAHRDDLVHQFSDFLAIPNVAADPGGLRRNADLLLAQLHQRNIDARLLTPPSDIPSQTPSAVYGHIDTPGAPTPSSSTPTTTASPSRLLSGKSRPSRPPSATSTVSPASMHAPPATTRPPSSPNSPPLMPSAPPVSPSTPTSVSFGKEKKKPVPRTSSKFFRPTPTPSTATSFSSAMAPSTSPARKPSSSAHAATPTSPSPSTARITACIADTTATGRPTPPSCSLNS